MTPGQILELAKTLVLLALIGVAVWFWQHYKGLVADNQQLIEAAKAHTAAINALNDRTRATDAAVAALNADATLVRSQTATALSRLDKARRNDPETQKVDRPWPAAVRFRVFDNPDPTTGSTTRAGVAPAGTGRVAVPEPRRPDAGSSSDTTGYR